MKPIKATQAGQVLPIALAGIAAFLLLIMFGFNLGRLMIERERTRMRTDLTVMSGAVIYARCLNVYAFAKKADQVADIASDIPYVGAVAAVIEKFISAAKKGVKYFGPYGTLGVTELVAYENQLTAVPFWNVKDFFDVGTLGKGMMPSLNFDNNENQSSGSGSNSGSGGSSEDRYSYRKQDSGRDVELGKDEVSQDQQGGAQGRYRDKQSGKFVKKDQGKAEGEHSLTIVTMNLPRDEEKESGAWKALPYFYSISRARISGGNFDTTSSSSMEWGCFLAPVTAKESPAAMLQIDEIPATGFSSIDSLTAKANAAIAEARQWVNRVPAILH